MATYTLSAGDALLKDYYISPIIEQVNYKTYMLDQVERDSEHVDFQGRRWIYPVHSGRNRGRGSRGDNASLPVAGYQTDQDAIDKIKYHYYAMEITDPVIEGAQKSSAAFTNLLERESKMLATEMRKDINRQIWGQGTGLLATKAKEDAKGKKLYLDSVQYIGVGDTVDVIKTSDGSTGNGVVGAEVTKRVSATESYIEIGTETAGATTTEYGVYISGNRSNEMPGLRNIVSKEREVHGINSSTAGNEFWDSKSINAEGNVAGESLFEQLLDEVALNGNGEIDVFVTTRGIKRRLADTYQSQKRFNDTRAVDIHGGYTAIFVNEKPVVTDDDCPKKYVFGINKDSFRWFEQTSPGWLEKDGVVFQLKNSTTAGQKMNVWQAWFKWYVSFGGVAPNRNGRITECKDDLPV